MSHYGNYIKEREGKHIIEDDNGFVSYSFENDYAFIEDMYVIPSQRKKHIALKYSNTIEKIAKEKGCKRVLCSICPSANNATISLKATLAIGYKLLSSQENIIYFVKEII